MSWQESTFRIFGWNKLYTGRHSPAWQIEGDPSRLPAPVQCLSRCDMVVQMAALNASPERFACAYGTLVPIHESGKRRDREIELWTTPLTIGRRQTCHVVISDETISATHCELTFELGAWFVRDLDSTNGTRVNHKRIQGKTPLSSGDTLAIGRRPFIIRYSQDKN